MHVAALSAAALLCLPVSAQDLRFDQIFNARGEPASLHYQAVFRAGGAEHRMEIWRDGDHRVRRLTDESVESVAIHNAGDDGFDLSILDLKKRIHTKISRTNLYRIGNFTDWFDLGHGLRHPKSDYRLTPAAAPKSAPVPLQPCDWYSLEQGGRANRICWSTQNRIPMLIVADDDSLSWRVTAVDRKPVPDKVFAIHDEGFVLNDANQDVEPD